jgi:superfamily II DNA or RNA helicase
MTVNVRRTLCLEVPLTAQTAKLRHALTFPSASGGKLYAFRQVGGTLLLPREYLSDAEMREMGWSVEDVDVHADRAGPYGLRNDFRTDDDGAQVNAYAHLSPDRSGILVLACGLGKTYLWLRLWAESGKAGLVIAPTVDLMRQWKDEALQHLDIPEEDIGFVRGARQQEWDRPLVIASLKTVAMMVRDDTLPPEVRLRFGLIAFDEVHRLGAPFFNDVAPQFWGTRIGLSATPERDDGLDALFRFHLGPVIYEDLNQPLDPVTYFWRTGVTMTPAELNQVSRGGNVNMPLLVGWLAKHEKRNEALAGFIQKSLDDGRTVLVLSMSIEHLHTLRRVFPQGGLITGAVKDKDRENAIKMTNPIFATTALAKEGLSRRDLDTIIIASPFKKFAMVQQVWGRALRTHKDKKQPSILVPVDDIHTTRRQAGEVRRHLVKLGYYFENL